MSRDLKLSHEEQRFFLQEACYVASNSPDPSTQNGSVLLSRRMEGDENNGFRLAPYVVAKGCNEFPFAVKVNEDRLERPLKYSFIEHAERNSLYNAAYLGERTKGLTMVCPWAACHDCARAIIQCGIYELITMRHETNDRWDSSIAIAMLMLEEAGVKITYFEGDVFDSFNKVELRRNGEVWLP